MVEVKYELGGSNEMCITETHYGLGVLKLIPLIFSSIFMLVIYLSMDAFLWGLFFLFTPFWALGFSGFYDFWRKVNVSININSGNIEICKSSLFSNSININCKIDEINLCVAERWCMDRMNNYRSHFVLMRIFDFELLIHKSKDRISAESKLREYQSIMRAPKGAAKGLERKK